MSSNLTIWDSKNGRLKLNIQINNKSDFGHTIEPLVFLNSLIVLDKN